MRKYIIGGIVGFMMAFAVSAHAEVISMVGKVVQGEVDLTINNQKMEYPAILIDGTTYAPVRIIGEATGYIVRFDEATGVKLIKKIITPPTTINRSIDALNSSITTTNSMITANRTELDRLRIQEQTNSVRADISRIESNIKQWNEDIKNCQHQIAKLNQTLNEIASQEAELNPPSQPSAPTQP